MPACPNFGHRAPGMRMSTPWINPDRGGRAHRVPVTWRNHRWLIFKPRTWSI